MNVRHFIRRYFEEGAFVLFAGLLGCVAVYMFYFTEVRTRAENMLFDVRTRLAPPLSREQFVTVAAIDAKTIRHYDGPEAKDLSFRSLNSIVNRILSAEPRQLVVLLHPQVFTYGSPDFEMMLEKARKDERLALGLFGLREVDPQFVSILGGNDGLRSRIFHADLWSDFRRQVVRHVSVGGHSSLHFAISSALVRPEVVATPVSNFGEKDRVFLNYSSLGSIDSVSAFETSESPSKRWAKKIVILGYTEFRPNSFQFDATFVNTPWQADGDDLALGVPLPRVHAVVFENALNHRWLEALPDWVNVLQTALSILGGFAAWFCGIGWASILFLGGVFVLLLFHGAMFTWKFLYLPLADTVLFACLATLVGAFWRLRHEGIIRAKAEATEASDAQLAKMHSRFLHGFALELGDMNARIHRILDENRHLASGDGVMQKAYVKALQASEELMEYLSGIVNFAGIRDDGIARVSLRLISLKPVVEKVLRQFESKIDAALLKVDVQIGDAQAIADETLLEQIFFNLVSNAVKYSPPGGLIRITADSAKRYTSLRIRDDGPGIAPEFHERIFEKFYRVKDDHVFKIKGQGLGLYLSRYFAKQMRAKVVLDSYPGKGSEFALVMRKG